MTEKEEFFKSYQNCASRLHTENIVPYVEQEILPIYAKEWVEFVLKNLLKVSSIEREQLINISVLRSMLVMDLTICDYANEHNLKQKVFDFYSKVLSNFYSQDKFSLYTNKHNDISYTDISDSLFFENKNIDLINLMNECFIHSYKKNGDIFADNTYEVLGPFYVNNHTIYINRFYINDKQYDFIQWSKYKCDGIIDMFGHADISLKEPNIILLHEDEFIFDTKNIKINFKDSLKDEKNSLVLLTENRIERYKNIISKDKLDNYKQLIKSYDISNIKRNRNEKLINKLLF